MSNTRYTPEFKSEAVKQITERGHSVADVSKRLGISDKSLYVWLKQSQQHAKAPMKDEVLALKGEISRMKAELIAIFLTACATTANYEKILSSWVGNNVDNLVSSWGPPESSYPLSDGGRVLQYSNQRNIQIGGYTTTVPQTTYNNGTVNAYGNGGSAYGNYSGTSTTYVQKTTPVQNIAMQCITRFTVNAQGVITKWAWQGNDCRARAPN